MRKPEPEIYGLTLERLGLAPGACAFLDDLDVNVDAACALGMHGIRFQDTEQAIRDLESVLAA
jgi:putative hydrolase of the HAD superfamily